MNPTFQNFYNEWNGKYISILNPGKQCFDVVAKWCDILKIPRFPGNPTPFPVANAYQIFTQFGPYQAQYFDRIFNEATNTPREGDIVVLSNDYNHIGGHTGIASGKGIANGTNMDWFELFQQNDPAKYPCRLEKYKFTNVYGWLRPKNYSVGLTDKEMVDRSRAIIYDTTKPDSDARYLLKQIIPK